MTGSPDADAGAPSAARIGFRPVTAADGPAIETMVARCSPASRYARFLAPYQSLPPSELDRVLHPGLRAGAWVALDASTVSADGAPKVVALAQWAMVSTDEAELGLLVEDDWQRQGIGTGLLTIVAAMARAGGARDLTATVLADARHVHRLLGTVFGTTTTSIDGPVASVTTAPADPGRRSQGSRHRSGTRCEDCASRAGGS